MDITDLKNPEIVRSLISEGQSSSFVKVASEHYRNLLDRLREKVSGPVTPENIHERNYITGQIDALVMLTSPLLGMADVLQSHLFASGVAARLSSRDPAAKVSTPFGGNNQGESQAP